MHTVNEGGDGVGAVSPSAGALHHLEFYVADLERSAAFWGDLLEQGKRDFVDVAQQL